MNALISRLEKELIDPRIDISDCIISEENGDTLVVSSKVGAFRIFLSFLFGVPSLYLLHTALIRPPLDHLLFIISALVFASVLAFLSLLFGFARSKKTFNRHSYEARPSFEIFGIKRERPVGIPKEGTVRLWSAWGDEDGPALWFYIDVGECEELGFCIGWKYRKALDLAQRLASFLSYKFVDLVSDDHRARVASPGAGA
jgi:hypothetical protein